MITHFFSLANFSNYPPPSGIVANRIKALYGTGGGYLSNEDHYRVAYLRETIRDVDNNGILPNGHIHIGFLSDDYYENREDMIDDMIYILENFLETL